LKYNRQLRAAGFSQPRVLSPNKRLIENQLGSVVRDLLCPASLVGLKPQDVFYVVHADAMLRIATRWAYSPALEGVRMHAPKIEELREELHIVSKLRWCSVLIKFASHQDMDAR
jgi:hypothetical protein